MHKIYIEVLLIVGLFLGIIASFEVGRFFRARRRADDIKSSRPGLSGVEAAIFGFVALILAFTFSWSFAHFDARRHLIIEEANRINTAYLRLSLLPGQDQSELKEKLRQYVDARVAAYRAFPDYVKVQAGIDRATKIQGEIWTTAVTATQKIVSPQASLLILPALDSMFDIANTRYMEIKMRRPVTMTCLISVLVLSCSLLAGFGMGDSKARSWIHIIIYAALLAMTIYTIIDLEYTRTGPIQASEYDQALIGVGNNR